MDEPLLGDRFGDALVWAHELHRTQTRKGGDIPYVAHLLGVTSLVLEAGAGEDVAIAALLHDAVEDQGVSPEEIEARFGARVARIVVGASDVSPERAGESRDEKTSFPRKERHLAKLRDEVDPDVLRVSLADKLHNLRSILADHRRHGDAVWKRFNVGRLGQLWYYREAVRVFRSRWPDDPHMREMRKAYKKLRDRAGDPSDRELDAAAEALRANAQDLESPRR